jgi:hypothetical protein
MKSRIQLHWVNERDTVAGDFLAAVFFLMSE